MGITFNPFTGTLDFTGTGGGGGGGTPGAPVTSVQFNDSGAFGGDADLTWNKTTNLLRFTSGSGLSLAGVGAPITMVGGTDGFGDTAIVIDNAVDGYVTFVYPQNTDINLGAGKAWSIGGATALLGLNDGTDTITLFAKHLLNDEVWASAATGAKQYQGLFQTHYTASDGSATADGVATIVASHLFGDGGVAAKGDGTSVLASMIWEGSGSASNESSNYYALASMKIGTGYAQTVGPTGNLWLADWQSYGPIAVKPEGLNGLSVLANNYFNGSPNDSSSNGIWLVTKKGAGNGDATHLAANTFAMDVGLGIAGVSDVGGVTGVGWTTGIQIGGTGGPWLEAASKIGTGLHIRDYVTAGIVIDNPSGSPTTSIQADGVVQAGNVPSLAIAVTGAVTATIGRMHYVTGTSADYTVTLPAASGLTNKRLSFVFGPTITELSKFVTIDGNASEKINGLLSRVFWAGEALTLECDGSNWWVVDYKFMPMACTMTKTTQNIGTGSQTKVTLDTTGLDNTGLMANTGSNKMTCRRTGLYTIYSQTSWNPTLAVILLQAFPKVNAVLQDSANRQSIAGGFVSCDITQPNVSITVGQDIELFAGNFSAGTETTAPNKLSVTEQAGW